MKIATGRKSKLKESLKQVEKPKQIVYEFDVDKINGKNRLNEFYKIYNGLWNYIFDSPKRKDSWIRVNISKTQYCTLRAYDLLVHLIFWRVLINFGVKITEKDLYIYEFLGMGEIAKIADSIIIKLMSMCNNLDVISEQISYSIDDLCELAEDYGCIACPTYSIYDTIQFAKRNKTFKNCIDTVLDDTKPVKEIENQIQEGLKTLIRVIEEDKQSCLYHFLRSGHLKNSQLSQMFYAIGPRANVDKTILPVIIKRNFLRGYDNVSEYYVETVTARNALILKRLNVSDSGYISRKVNLLCLGTHLNGDIEDCGTKHYITLHITNQSVLDSLVSKYRILDNGKLEEIDPKRDTHLVGQTIKIRSTICCALPDGHICKHCYGAKARQIEGTLAGIFPSIKIANVFSNLNMQAKHFQITNSIEVASEVIKKYFISSSLCLFLKDGINPKHIHLIVKKDELEEVIENSTYTNIEDDDSAEYSLPLETLRLVDLKDPDNPVTYDLNIEGVIFTLSESVLSRSKKFITDLDSEDITIKLSTLDLEDPILHVTLITDEISRYMDRLTKIIDSSLTNTYESPDSLLQDYLDTLSNSKVVKIRTVHFETILYNLIRDANKLWVRPDYSKPEKPQIKMLSIKQGLMKKDLWTAISFQDLKAQFIDPDSFKKRNGGIFDGLFRTVKPKHLIPIDRIKLAKFKSRNA